MESDICHINHWDKCKFVADLYLEFTDKEHTKQTGYKRYREQDFNFGLCYKNYIEHVDLEDCWQLQPVK